MLSLFRQTLFVIHNSQPPKCNGLKLRLRRFEFSFIISYLVELFVHDRKLAEVGFSSDSDDTSLWEGLCWMGWLAESWGWEEQSIGFPFPNCLQCTSCLPTFNLWKFKWNVSKYEMRNTISAWHQNFPRFFVSPRQEWWKIKSWQNDFQKKMKMLLAYFIRSWMAIVIACEHVGEIILKLNLKRCTCHDMWLPESLKVFTIGVFIL